MGRSAARPAELGLVILRDRGSRGRVPKKLPQATRRAAIRAAFRVALRASGDVAKFWPVFALVPGR